MFFRREKPRKLSFQDFVAKVRQAGFAVQESGGRVSVSKYNCATTIEDGGERPRVSKPGYLMGTQLAELVDGGFQKFWQTPDGKRSPATAEDLRALHNFQEDLKEALGLVSLYNEGLGTTSAAHLYDRVKDRDHGMPQRPWEQVRR